MGSSSCSENYSHANKKNVVLELLKGKEFAVQLQTLLQKPEPKSPDDSADQLALQILRSFTHTLSVLSSSTESAESAAQIAVVDCGGSACSGQSKNKKGVKDRRGCYKRRRSSDSWVTVTSTMEDGSAWRKYGQKDIMNSKYPRCYFRCTHKSEGCKATKQVQIIQENPVLHQTTYFNQHTCSSTGTKSTPHLMIMDSDHPVESNLISFQTKNMIPIISHQQPVIYNISSVKQETKQDHTAQSSDHDDQWQLEIARGAKSLEYKPVFGPIMSSSKEADALGFHSSCESITNLHEFDMEVNQLGDIDNFQNYFD